MVLIIVKGYLCLHFLKRNRLMIDLDYNSVQYDIWICGLIRLCAILLHCTKDYSSTSLWLINIWWIVIILKAHSLIHYISIFSSWALFLAQFSPHNIYQVCPKNGIFYIIFSVSYRIFSLLSNVNSFQRFKASNKRMFFGGELVRICFLEVGPYWGIISITHLSTLPWHLILLQDLYHHISFPSYFKSNATCAKIYFKCNLSQKYIKCNLCQNIF